jgi:hypothetical protein
MDPKSLQQSIDLSKTQEVLCEECDNNTFEQVVMLRTASRFLTGTPQDALIPIPTFACTKCHYINEDFKPKELQK